MRRINTPIRVILAVCLALLTAFTLSSCGKTNNNDNNNNQEVAITQPSPDFTPGEKFLPEGLVVEAGTQIADSVRADINHDSKADEIVLTGLKQDGDPYMHNVSITVKDGKSGKFVMAPIGQDNVGYEPTLLVGSFAGKGSKEFLVSVATGGSGGITIYSLLHYSEGQINVLITQEELNKGLLLTTTCRDGFKLNINDKSTGYATEIDLSSGKDDYVEMEIYDKTGKLLQDPMVLVDGYSLMKAEDVNKDGTLELHGYQAISVGAHANQVAEAESVWSVTDGALKLLEEKVISSNQK